MNVLEAIRTRRSIGKLGGDVSDADVRELIECATWAPNHHNTEPWTFTVLRGAARERLGEAWAAALDRSTELDPDAWRREARKPLRAPVIVAVSTRTDPDPQVALEDFAAVAAAVENLLLAAQSKGLGAIWRTGAMAYSAAIVAHLALAPTDRIVAFVYLGSPEMRPPPAQRRDVASVSHWRT